jgi:hypothetical protein
MISIFDVSSNYFDDGSLFTNTNVEILVDVVEDISEAVSVQLHVILPQADLIYDEDLEENILSDIRIWDGNIYNNTYIKYNTQEDDLKFPGIYKINAIINFADSKIIGETACLLVRNIGE